MVVNLQIDQSQIDYDKINEAILKKIEESSLEEIIKDFFGYDSQKTIRNSITALIQNGTNDYIVSQEWYSSRRTVQETIKQMANDEVSRRLHEEVDKIFATLSDNDMDTIRQFIYLAMPNIITDWIFNKLDQFHYESTDMRQQIVMNQFRDLLANKGIFI